MVPQECDHQHEASDLYGRRTSEQGNVPYESKDHERRYTSGSVARGERQETERKDSCNGELWRDNSKHAERQSKDRNATRNDSRRGPYAHRLCTDAFVGHAPRASTTKVARATRTRPDDATVRKVIPQLVQPITPRPTQGDRDDHGVGNLRQHGRLRRR